MHNLFISLHPELVFPFQLRRSGRWREVDLPDTLPALPSCPNPECHTVRMQLPGAHDPQSYPSPENPPSSLGPNTTITPSDEGFTNAHAAPVSQPVAPSFPSPSPPCEPSAILSISPNVSRGSGAPMVDASPPSHVSDDTSEPSRSSSPIASFTVQRGETSTTSLLHGAQDAAGWSGP
ncbi:hypothetical protein BC834DRAFT_898659 [Gloeopeniophorella convolvens]|nr:hypothetical protein BC834DRAFT_898659 [Gloeopeniophorella convolvens]